jgi:hypothetical protein
MTFVSLFPMYLSNVIIYVYHHFYYLFYCFCFCLLIFLQTTEGIKHQKICVSYIFSNSTQMKCKIIKNIYLVQPTMFRCSLDKTFPHFLAANFQK